MNLTEHFHRARIPQRRYGDKFASPKFKPVFRPPRRTFPRPKWMR